MQAIHQSVGDLVAAARLYRSALDQPWCPPEIRAKVANNLALAEVQLGRYGAAIEHIDVAAAAAHEAGPVLVAIVAQSRAWVTMQAGRLAESLDHFAAAEQLYLRADLPLDEHYIEYADALVDLRLVPEALRVARRAVSELAAHGAELMAAEGQVRLARLLLLTGDAAAARDTASRAAATFRRQRRTAWVARAVVVAHQAQAALEPLDAARLRSLRGCARTLEQLGLTSEAIPAYLAVGVESARRGRVADASEVLGRADRLARGAPVLVRLKGRIAAARLAQLHG
jgi:tetratricopeptide (TPR) repeat protein